MISRVWLFALNLGGLIPATSPSAFALLALSPFCCINFDNFARTTNSVFFLSKYNCLLAAWKIDQIKTLMVMVVMVVMVVFVVTIVL